MARSERDRRNLATLLRGPLRRSPCKAPRPQCPCSSAPSVSSRWFRDWVFKGGGRVESLTPTADVLERKVSGAYNRIWKPTIGIVIAVPLLVLLTPLLLVVAIAIAIDSGLPILYRAERGGLHGKPFVIFKFRTMVPDADKLGGGTTSLADPRITRIGSFLRKVKLDEFPQLLNIIRGDMCFVGPRPELIAYTDRYSSLERYILEVRPGITDFSSIEFINLDEVVGSVDADSNYEEHVLPRKNRLRLNYVMEMSPRQDMRVFVVTVAKSIRGALRHTFKRKK